jgi:hypothetical protein
MLAALDAQDEHTDRLIGQISDEVWTAIDRPAFLRRVFGIETVCQKCDGRARSARGWQRGVGVPEANHRPHERHTVRLPARNTHASTTAIEA